MMARSLARHFAIISSPTAGHINPLQVLGAALIAMGHRVTVVHVPGAARLITDPAIGFAALPGDTDGDAAFDAFLAKLADPQGPRGLRRMIHATVEMTRALLDGASAVIERIGADTVIADAVEPAGPLVAQRLGLPCVVSVTGLPLMREPTVPPPFIGWPYRRDTVGLVRNHGGYAIADWLMRASAQLLDDRRRDWGLGRADAPLVQVAQCPRALDYPRVELPPRFRYGSPWRAGPQPRVTLPDDGRPLIFCSLGTLQGSRRALFAAMAQACADVGARAVIGHGSGLTPDEETALPGDPLVRAFWPQEQVLRQCAAAMLHCGFNTVLDALAAGVPIVALPIAYEQPATAERLAWTGAGIVVPVRRLDTNALTRALRSVIAEPRYRQAAVRIGADMATAGGAAGAAAAIDTELAARR